jgi:hypothetical protein
MVLSTLVRMELLTLVQPRPRLSGFGGAHRCSAGLALARLGYSLWKNQFRQQKLEKTQWYRRRLFVIKGNKKEVDYCVLDLHFGPPRRTAPIFEQLLPA